MADRDLQKEINDFMEKVDQFNADNCPGWLTPNSYGVGVIPGHNLDLLQIWFDYKIDRSTILRSETPDFLKDPSKADLNVVKGD